MVPSVPPGDRDRVYPEAWDRVAEVRVLRAKANEWDKLIAWRADMIKKGWKLLRVTSDTELVAIFGKTRTDLQSEHS